MRKTCFRAAALALLAVFAAASLFGCAPRSEQAWEEKTDVPAEQGESEYFDYLGTPVKVAPTVALNSYDSSAFSFRDGILSYSAADTAFGVDVSSHQDDVDWQRVKAAGVDFAMIRVGYRGSTEGKLYLDNRFLEYMQGAKDAGLDVGVYFFSQATSVDEATAEARQVIEWLDGYALDYPVVYDWERSHDDGSRTLDVTGDVVTAACVEFCGLLRKAGYTPMVYFNLDLAYMYYDLSALTGIDFWLAEYEEVPTFHYDYQMLQYSAHGDIDGIGADVDLNLCFKKY
ncbi:MAG: glycoside hydrolase family 25 protein [Oscillospiraceae bacterium]|nr:glycoside hydrolase family 25 protein [Oscillospiraceae bacterium]